MIQILLSLILSMAMMVSGVGSPAELPGDAQSWSLGNVKLNVLGMEYDLEPWLNLTGEISEGGASLQFDATSKGTTLLPVSLGIDGDALKLSFGTGDRVYTIGDDVLMEMLELDADNLDDMQLMGEFYLGYASLMSALKNDPDLVEIFRETVYDTFLEIAVSGPEEVEVEVDGLTLSADRLVIDLTAADAVRIVDALADSGVPEFKAIYDKILAIGNENAGTNYASFSEVLEAEYSDEAHESLGMPFTLTTFETDDITYVGMDLPISEDDVQMHFAEELVLWNEKSNVSYTMSAQSPSDGVSFDVLANTVTQGPLYAPTSSQTEMTISGTINDDELAMDFDAHISYQEETDADGLNSGSFGFSGNLTNEQNAIPFNFTTEWGDRADTRGSVTTGVALKLNAMNIDLLGLNFDVNRMAISRFDAFGNMTEMPLTLELLEGDDDDPEVLNFMSALMADASRAYMDAMQLYSNSGLQQLVDDFTAILGNSSAFTNASARADDATIGVIGGPDGPTAIFTASAD